MKTIAFYSYKGGTGKSLTAANLAVCLSRLGKHCALVDCDVEGPSLHNKFYHVGRMAIGRGGGKAAGGGGFVGLVAECLKDSDWDHSQLDKLKPFTIEDIQRFIYEIPTPWPRATTHQHKQPGISSKLAGPERAGTIHLLPAGNIYSDDYWDVVWSPLWRDIFTIYDKLSDNKLTRQAFAKILGFLLNIKDALSRLTPPPEYMIVDLRAGASELATTLINAWADCLVYCFSFNEDNIQYLGETFFKLEGAGADRDHIAEPLRPVLVLSRVPSGIDYYRGDRELRTALDAMRIKWDDIHILHSDRDLEMQEELRLGYKADPQNRRLTNEYLKLFEQLLAEPGERPGWLKEAIGLEGEVSEEKDRVFNWEPEVGALINPNDDSRNVSFKVQTFQLLLQGLATGISTIVDGAPAAGERGSELLGQTTLSGDKTPLQLLLCAAGLRCGEEFGDSLASKWKGERISVEDKIDKWCSFDSDVGFGRFELNPETIETKGQRLRHCDIVLRESFLTAASDFLTPIRRGHHPYCELMTGYIQGVLQRILHDDITVTHGVLPDNEERSGARSQSCLFTVAPVADKVTDLNDKDERG